jgi:arginine/lysine/ornithine decarboxylase
MSTFASTSPSYLILQSLDLANDYLEKNYRKQLETFTKKVDLLKKRLSDTGYLLIGNEPLKLTVSSKSYGYTGNELADILSSHKIVCEFSDPDFTVLMMTPESSEESLERLAEVLLSIERRLPIESAIPSVGIARKLLSPRDAMLSPSCEIPIQESVGRILACESVGCPPAIPIVICGEEISKDAVRVFEYYGIKTVVCTEKN